MKKTVRLTESELRSIVRKNVSEALNEASKKDIAKGVLAGGLGLGALGLVGNMEYKQQKDANDAYAANDSYIDNVVDNDFSDDATTAYPFGKDVHESRLHRIIKESINRVLNEGADFYDFIEILEDYGFEYTNYSLVSRGEQNGTRYTLAPIGKDADLEGLKQALYSAYGEENVIFGTATNRYAPEQKFTTVVIVDDMYDE